MLTFGSLFAGIGNFDRGFEAAGMSCLWQVEIEPDCRSVLARYFPHAERFTDVREVGRHNLKPVDVICGGFPCQDLSVAGKRGGLAGERSGLFYEMVRIADELKPSFLVWENVPGLISSDDGRDFARVLRALDDIGYSGAWTGLDAQWFGVAQRRRRIFGVFARADIGAARCAEILSLGSRLRRNPPTRGEAGARVAAPVKASSPSRRNGGSDPTADEFVTEPFTFDWQAGSSGDTSFRGKARSWIEDKPGRTRSLTAFDWQSGGDVRHNASESHTSALQASQTPAVLMRNREGCDGGGKGPLLSEDKSLTLAAANDQVLFQNVGVRRLTPRECERLQGCADDWALYGASGEVISDSARYRMLGNAVAEPCARWIGRQIIRHAEGA